TLGKPQVTDIISCNEAEPVAEKVILGYAAAIEIGSVHPIAKAIVAKSTEMMIKLPIDTNIKAVARAGIHGNINQQHIQISIPNKLSSLLLTEQNRYSISRLENEGQTVVVGLKSHKIIGFIALRDALRSDSVKAIAMFNDLG